MEYIDTGHKLVDNVLEIEVFLALYNLYNMAWNVHPLVVNCREAPDTALDILISRFNDSDDIRLILTNILHNASFVIETSTDVWNFLTSSERGQTDEGPYEAGYGAGRLIYYILTDNE